MRVNRPYKLWPNWRDDPKSCSIVATFEALMGCRLSVIDMTNTGAPVIAIVSPRRGLRRKAKKLGLVYGCWPSDGGGKARGWIPGPPAKKEKTNPYRPRTTKKL
tara:strand:+ start:717 stop:1028 length:312 start_codon:yes stop_codon:yes gene_type:complete